MLAETSAIVMQPEIFNETIFAPDVGFDDRLQGVRFYLNL